MPELSKDVVALLQYLLPGFLVAWVLYGLTSHQKPSQFERIVQALIFTLAVRVLVFFERLVVEHIGQWSSETDLVCSFLSAIALGVIIARVLNTDSFHSFLRKTGLSNQSAYPSEWCSILSEHVRWVVLHFKDDRRLYGWPKVWPSDSEKGHFFITHPSWIDADGKDHSLEPIEGLLVNAADIKWVEFLNKPEDSNGNKTDHSNNAT